MDIEDRLKRIERKLFPENLKTLYDFAIKCSNENCYDRYWPSHVTNYPKYPIKCKVNTCRHCGSEMIISDIHEHKEIVFEDQTSK